MNKFHRILSLFFCLVLLSSFVFSPIRAQAAFNPAAESAIAVVGGIAVDVFTEGAKLVASALASASESVGNLISVDFLSNCAKVSTLLMGSNSFASSFTAFRALSGTPGSQLVLDDDFCSDLSDAVEEVIDEPIEVPAAGTQIYVPPDAIWTQAELITYDRLLYDGFSNLESLNDNVLAGNKISWQHLTEFMKFEGYFRTDFLNSLSSEFDSLSTNLTTELTSLNTDLSKEVNDVEAWVNKLDSDLISKLDILNTSIGSLSTTLSGKLDTINSTLTSKLDALDGTVSVMDVGLYNQLVSLEESIWDMEGSIWDLEATLSEKLDAINTSTQNLGTLGSSDASIELLGSIVDSIDFMEESLSDDLTDLKSLYSTFGNSVVQSIGSLETTLSGKLDALDGTVSVMDVGLYNQLVSLEQSVWDLEGSIWDLEAALSEKLDAINTSTQNLGTLGSSDASIELLGSIEESIDFMEESLSDDLTDLKTLYSTFGNSVVQSIKDVDTAIGSLNTSISDELSAVTSEIGDLKTDISSDLGALQAAVVGSITSVNTSIGSLKTSLDTLISNSDTWDRITIDRVMENLQQIKELQVGARDKLHTELLKIAEYEVTINTNMKDYLQDVKDGLFSLQKNVVYRLQTVETAINNLPSKLGTLDDALLEQVEGIGTSLGVITAPTVTTPDTSIIDSYGKQEDSLKIPINNGFAIGGSYFLSIRDFLTEDLNGFLVAGLIFEEFAGISFFHKLIITSCSVGLIGTLLGMALSVQSFNLSQKRRQEAAQVRAHGRMERSRAA